ncbi:uncharacterized protein LOC113147600 [Cyclospora cayetanensis]|uniref:Uncharacterized protein LOC113147600 n=1 Tax=Cyclospora cayetanensis TaxID=88456 RepID=A0A6P6S2U9_9EIME|nr:uncharacterized protein LOC113147600 [Cyclospora cayetanensis]
MPPVLQLQQQELLQLHRLPRIQHQLQQQQQHTQQQHTQQQHSQQQHTQQQHTQQQHSQQQQQHTQQQQQQQQHTQQQQQHTQQQHTQQQQQHTQQQQQHTQQQQQHTQQQQQHSSVCAAAAAEDAQAADACSTHLDASTLAVQSGLVVVSASTAGAAAAPPLAEARAAFRGVRQQIQQHKQQIQQPKQQMQQPKQQIESQPFEGQGKHAFIGIARQQDRSSNSNKSRIGSGSRLPELWQHTKAFRKGSSSRSSSSNSLVGALAELLGGDTGGDRRGSSKELPAESDDDILLLPRPSQQQQLPDRASALPAQPLQNQQQQNPPKGRCFFYGLLLLLLLLLAGALLLGCLFHKHKLVRMRPRDLQRLQLATFRQLQQQLLQSSAQQQQHPLPLCWHHPQQLFELQQQLLLLHPSKEAAAVFAEATAAATAGIDSSQSAALSSEAAMLFLQALQQRKQQSPETEFCSSGCCNSIPRSNSNSASNSNNSTTSSNNSASSSNSTSNNSGSSNTSNSTCSLPPFPRGVWFFVRAKAAKQLRSFISPATAASPASVLVCAEEDFAYLAASASAHAAAAASAAKSWLSAGASRLKAAALSAANAVIRALTHFRNIQHAASAAVQAGAASVMGVVPSLASPGTTTAADFPSTCAAFPGECMQCSSLKASETQLLQSPPQQLPRQPLQQEAVCVPTPHAAGSPKAACCEMAFELILMQLLEQQQVTLSDPRGRLILYASALRAATGGLLPSAFLRLFDQEKQAPSAASAARLWEISVAPSETPPPGEVSEAAEYAQSEKGAFGSLPLVSLQPEFAAFGTPCYPLARFLHQRLLGWGGLQLHLLLLGGWGFSLFSAAPLTLVHVPRAAFLSLLILYRGICLYTGFNWLGSKLGRWLDQLQQHLQQQQPLSSPSLHSGAWEEDADEGEERISWTDIDVSDHVLLYVLAVLIVAIETSAAFASRCTAAAAAARAADPRSLRDTEPPTNWSFYPTAFSNFPLDTRQTKFSGTHPAHAKKPSPPGRAGSSSRFSSKRCKRRYSYLVIAKPPRGVGGLSAANVVMLGVRSLQYTARLWGKRRVGGTLGIFDGVIIA